ncbi:phosphoserine phosphatase SerB [Desulfovibrio ferrophilus]|uniref:Phosphoserine phosphatase n=1 Tax=Desulfovibrio ferrophilus TaxID=241368 RepID=A0A2Z6AZZ2_9BACT|nr:phosphoserine phosphatase SerB [Desulfovibrio ferrophilus]BBD08814.1 phosphoserine phosphatase SerB [Desulfovibrio ferrophilus]
MSEIFLIKISGEDKPGIMSHMSRILADYGVRILDLGQAVIHNTLSLGMIIDIPEAQGSAPILKDLLYGANELGVKLKFVPVTEAKHEDWVQAQGRKRYIVTLLSREIGAEQIARVTGVMTDVGLNIDFISRLSGRISLVKPDALPRACVEFSVRGEPSDMLQLRSAFMDITGELGVDISFQEDNVYRRNRRLVAFDMDSTLIQAEVIDELARKAGVVDEVSRITESAMRGELDFKESLRERVALLKGLDASVLEEVAEEVPFTEGAERLVSNLKKLGYKIAILSGGFTYFGQHLKRKLGVDHVYANELEIKDGKLTGKVVGEIVDGKRKAELLEEIALTEDISLQQVVAVGDGANDLPMLGVAGLGIAFHAKPIVREGARQAISTLGLDGILYLLGLRDREAE